MSRKFPKVPKSKKGVPLKYLAGAKNPKGKESRDNENKKII